LNGHHRTVETTSTGRKATSDPICLRGQFCHPCIPCRYGLLYPLFVGIFCGFVDVGIDAWDHVIDLALTGQAVTWENVFHPQGRGSHLGILIIMCCFVGCMAAWLARRFVVELAALQDGADG